jgi:hypothetical protein
MKNYPTMKDVTRKVVITVDKNQTLARIYEDNKVVAKGVAICSPEDTFDFRVGSELALSRALEDMKPKQEWVVVDRKPRAGDYIRLTRSIYDFDNKGDVLRVVSVLDNKVFVSIKEHPKCKEWIDRYFRGWWSNDEWIYTTSEYEVVEPAPKKPEFRKIAREPKIGDYVRAVKSVYSFDDPNCYLKIWNVLREDNGGKVVCVTVHSDDHHGALAAGQRFDSIHWNYNLGCNKLEFYEKV